MPAITHPELGLGEPPSAARSYHHISLSQFCTGLALLTILIIIRLVACRAFVSTTSKKDKAVQRHGFVVDDITHLINQQRLHPLFVQEKGWVMEEKSRNANDSTQDARVRPTEKVYLQVNCTAGDGDSREPKKRGSDATSRSEMLKLKMVPGPTSENFILSRPPLPPPLTPPELSPSVFAYDGRRRSFTSGVSELDASFFEQPNPDYVSSTSIGTSTATQKAHAMRSSPTPRRRSYTKTLPIGEPAHPTGPVLDGLVTGFPLSSFPPTSPLLPGPPPIYGEILYDETTNQEVLVQGEIISILDDAGAGWKRHTRVYGGGACLACAASCDDGHHGGFYGENVLPEERRY
ncbi:hypothetical protein CTA2_8870 [Colletotrichum tanaceti]|uniref:Uncharacterized protein n=1 Tax=Colletotrichum tanaceti TaxID=1306861 RepID=A0A4U6XFW6_9PEZI|nr:hypothetical protein CTA2_8870 [Colletotrichum tanaceti]TKW54454.1 hypothetical protein CTA1_9703 [Colletotrichum tanaceti]